ncbi:MAG: molybdenum cofactor guanylyltransferase, partial [Chloroflexi bacterium]|nr:molybdenum cofactor guanylyltransferase [Chloroflexota bacterium]
MTGRADIGRVSLAILAGGEGARLGGEKAGLLLGGERLIDRALRRLAWLSEDRWVVLRRGQALTVQGARLAEDLAPYEGPLAGMAAALKSAHLEWVFVLACDMPFVQRPVVEALLALAEGCQAVVPRLRVGLEPLHALYHT